MIGVERDKMSHAFLVLLTSVSVTATATAIVWYFSSSVSGSPVAVTTSGLVEKGPVILVSSTFHARFKPVRHSFRYPVLYVGVDLDCIGYVDSIFSTVEKTWRPLHLRSADYLGTKHGGTIKEKLWAHLTDHGIDTARLRRSFLVTTPRLLGYAFNPVSFHYIYDVEGTLTVVVLEVNNTFGEKHIYVLRQDLAAPAATTGDRVRSGYSTAQTFPRKFHVSPFNDRSGSYQLQCLDPFTSSSSSGGAAGAVDMHLTVLEEDGTKKLTAQVNSTRPPIPTRQTLTCTLALLRHGAGVFLTMPRILLQAYKLHYGKRLAVYLRPEPFEALNAVARQGASKTDLYFMALVVAYLTKNREWIPCKRVRFVLLPDAPPRTIDVDGSQDSGEELIVTVLSYTFFTSLVTSESPLTTLWTDSLATSKSPSFRVSDETLFLKVFTAGFSRPLDGRYYLSPIRTYFRGQPTWFASQLKDVQDSHHHVEYLTQTNGGFDNHVYEMSLASKQSLWAYRYHVIMALVSQWIGNAIFGAVATFAGEAGRPADEWLRVKQEFERRKKQKTTT